MDSLKFTSVPKLERVNNDTKLIWLIRPSKMVDGYFDENCEPIDNKGGIAFVAAENIIPIAYNPERLQEVENVEYLKSIREYFGSDEVEISKLMITTKKSAEVPRLWYEGYDLLKINLVDEIKGYLHALNEEVLKSGKKVIDKANEQVIPLELLSKDLGEGEEGLVSFGQFGRDMTSTSQRRFIEIEGSYTYNKFYDYVKSYFSDDLEKLEVFLGMDDGFLLKLYQAQRDFGMLQIMTGNPKKMKEHLGKKGEVSHTSVEPPVAAKDVDSVVARIGQMADANEVFDKINYHSNYGEYTTFVNMDDEERKFYNVAKKNDLALYAMANNSNQTRLTSYVKMKNPPDVDRMALSGYFTFSTLAGNEGIDDLDVIAQIYVSVSGDAEDMAQITFGNFLMTATTSEEFRKKLKDIPIDALTVYLKQGLPPLQVLINLYTTDRFRDIYDTVVKVIIAKRSREEKLNDVFDNWFKMKSELTRCYRLREEKNNYFITMVQGQEFLAFDEDKLRNLVGVLQQLRYKYDAVVACDRRSYLSLSTILSLYPCQALEHRILNDITYHNDTIVVVDALQYVRVGKLHSNNGVYRRYLYDEEGAKVSIDQGNLLKYYQTSGGTTASLIDYSTGPLISRVYLSSVENPVELITPRAKENRASVLVECAIGDWEEREKQMYLSAVSKLDKYHKCTVIVPISYAYEVYKAYNVVYIVQAPLPNTMAITMHVDKSKVRWKLKPQILMQFVYCQLYAQKLAMDFYLYGKTRMRQLIRAKLSIEYDQDLAPIINYWYKITKQMLGKKITSSYSKLLKTSKSLKKADKMTRVGQDIDILFDNANANLFVKPKMLDNNKKHMGN